MAQTSNDQELAECGGDAVAELAAPDDFVEVVLDVKEDGVDVTEVQRPVARTWGDQYRLGRVTEELRRLRSAGLAARRLDRAGSILDVIEHPNDWGATYSDRESDRNGRRRKKKRSGSGGYDDSDDDDAAASEAAPERQLTRFALRIAILEKAASGVGTLAFVWATVVLLGGFAVLLQPKDFYFVTTIVLIEGTRVFTRNHELDSGFFFRATKAEPCSVSGNVGWILTSLQLLSATACAALSAMRLVEQHYGDVDQDATKRNRAPALDIFYGLALAQALLFLIEKAYWHWKISYGQLLEQTRRACGFGASGIISLRRFFHNAYWKCISGSVFDALDMDLTSFALALVNSESRGERLIGARILYSYVMHELYADDTVDRIVTSAQTVRRLVAMLGWKSPADEEIRLHAARVVARLAGDRRRVLRVIGIPGAMQSIASLLHAGKREDDHDETYYAFNLLGLHILKHLSHDVDNCRQIRNTRGLLPKIIEFTRTSPSLLQDERVPVVRITLVKRSLKVVMRLVREVPSRTVDVGDRDPYRPCDGKGCEEEIGSTGQVIELLLSNFLSPEGRGEQAKIVVEAGDALAMLTTESKSNCAEILKGSEEVVMQIGSLLDVGAVRVPASKLLRNLCMYAGSEFCSRLRGVGAALPPVLEAIMTKEGKLLEVSIGLSVEICKLIGPEDYAKEVDQLGIKATELANRLAQILRKHDGSTVKLPRIRRSVIEQAIWLMKSNSKYSDLFKVCGMAKEMEYVVRTTSELESFILFSGSVGVNKYRKSMASLVQTAIGLMGVPRDVERLTIPIPHKMFVDSWNKFVNEIKIITKLFRPPTV
ncbi:hypothetical protein ACMD2_26829 [Ananas comosus]|uniref:Uncharacterized protein n=1 Tax=Ananas comosus TaxID=4615 RepID=A0A199VDW1_ANACO|nr:hypothetical protein ACMD2_26829 [Ananas comosus]